MTVREQVKAEIDKVRDRYLNVLFRTIRSLEVPAHRGDDAGAWGQFIAAHYGCLAEAPIERGDPGELEVREPLR
jgi:hypothetical protein